MPWNKHKVREREKQFRSKAKTARLEYKYKIEEHFKSMNARDACRSLNVIMGRNTLQHRVKCQDPVKFVHEMNTFYARFDDNDFRNECDDLWQSLDPLPVTVFDDDVVSVLSHVNPRKAPGSDDVVSVLSHVNPRKAPGSDDVVSVLSHVNPRKAPGSDDVASVLSHVNPRKAPGSDDVVSVLSHVNPRKAPGPDGLKGKVLKVCTT